MKFDQILIFVNLKHRVIIAAQLKYTKIIITADFIAYFDYNSANIFTYITPTYDSPLCKLNYVYAHIISQH